MLDVDVPDERPSVVKDPLAAALCAMFALSCANEALSPPSPGICFPAYTLTLANCDPTCFTRSHSLLLIVHECRFASDYLGATYTRPPAWVLGSDAGVIDEGSMMIVKSYAGSLVCFAWRGLW